MYENPGKAFFLLKKINEKTNTVETVNPSKLELIPEW